MTLDLPSSFDEFFLKMELRRTNTKYDHIPIDTVCGKHKNAVHKNPIIPLTDHKKYLAHGAAQLFKLGRCLEKDLQQKISIMFPCPDSCSRGTKVG